MLGSTFMKPLSSFKYFINNKKRSFSMALAIAVSVLMVLLFQIVFYAVIESGRLTYAGRLDHMTVISPGDNGTVSRKVIDIAKKCPDTERTIPFSVNTTDYYHFFGNLHIPIYTVGEYDLKYIMNRFGLKIIEGRLPEKGKNEIVLDARTAKNKGKKIGDYIGREVDKTERMSGKYKLVGLLDGDCLIGLNDSFTGNLTEEKGFLLFPKEGRLDSMNDIFKKISPEDARIMTKAYGESVFREDLDMMKLVSGIMTAVIISIMSFAAGNSSYAQYFSRRYEFATLQSIGYSRAQVLLRAGREISLLNLFGFMMGMLLTVAGAFVLKILIYDPKGYPFVLIQFDGLIKAIIIPACTALFSLIPAWWTLSKVNQLEVIERYE